MRGRIPEQDPPPACPAARLPPPGPPASLVDSMTHPPRPAAGRLRLSLAAALVLAGSAAAAPPDQVKFNRDVRPILSQNCFSCHGPAKQKAGLRLDSAEAATKKLKSGETAVVP